MSEADKTNEPNLKTQKLRMAGSKLAHFTIIRELGHGGQGCVFLARDEILGRAVALKVLHGAHALHHIARLRFAREAEIASKLAHPGLCAVHELGEHEGTPYIAMQYVKGTPLSDKISSARESAKTHDVSFVALEGTTSIGPVMGSPDDKISDLGHDARSKNDDSLRDRDAIMNVVALIEDTARALHTAHEKGLIHRDIKPANIMLADDGRPVILDFGLARDDDSDAGILTQTGDLMGTPAYMSPEQITRSSIRVDRRSDVYSLGVTLFECLTLKRPFAAANREELYQAVLFQHPPNPRKLNRAIPNDLRLILEMALEKDPSRRYQTALGFAEDLRRIREYEPIFAKPTSPWVKMLRWGQRNRKLSAAIVVMLVCLGVAIWSWFRAFKTLRDSVPSFGGPPREAANESFAISSLRVIASAQAMLKEKAAVDIDGDGVGEFGSFLQLAGRLSPMPDQESEIDTANRWHPLLMPTWREVDDLGRVFKGGYLFKIFLPNDSGCFRDSASLKPPSIGEIADLSEEYWVAYAWPLDDSKGTRAFVVDSFLNICETRMQVVRYSNARSPEWNSAFYQGSMSLNHLTENNPESTLGMDGNKWVPLQ